MAFYKLFKQRTNCEEMIYELWKYIFPELYAKQREKNIKALNTFYTGLSVISAACYNHLY